MKRGLNLLFQRQHASHTETQLFEMLQLEIIFLNVTTNNFPDSGEKSLSVNNPQDKPLF